VQFTVTAHADAMRARASDLGAALGALGLAGASLASPPLALLLLALLAANAAISAREFRLKPLLAPGVAAVVVYAFVGLAGAIGLVFVWRLAADARWSVKTAQNLAASAGRPKETSARALAHAWATPLHGLALVAYTAPHMVAGLPLDLPPMPAWVPLCTGAVALFMVFDWALRRAAEWRLGELAPAPAAHLLAHHALFALAFGMTLDVSAGLVAMAAWRLLHAAPLPGLRRAQPSFTAVP
jgi:hypothetical protein